MASLLVVYTLIIAMVSGNSMPPKMIGMYCLIADDTVPDYTSNAQWQPQLYDFQINGTNVLWLTFINPIGMKVPPAMANLAKCKGNKGCPPTTTKVIFSVGGEAYSNAKWSWLQTKEAALSMAQNVSKWDTLYGADGIDLDIEGTAGMDQTSAENLVYFAQQLRLLNPNLIISQPVYGYPQITAENMMVNNGWKNDSNGNWISTNLIDSIGIMVYQNQKSLNYVHDYQGTTESYGWPIVVDVPYGQIQVGLQGGAGSSDINEMTNSVIKEKLNGIMVWYTSVFDATRNTNALVYDKKSNAYPNNLAAWSLALKTLINS